MTGADLLADAFERVRDTVHSAIDELSDDTLTYRPDDNANTIAWLVWHLTRVQDDHIAGVAGREQVWISQGYADRFGLPFEASATGYGQSAEEVGAVRVGAGLLGDYLDAVTAQTLDYVKTRSGDDLDQVVDASFDPPVTLAVRLVSVISDDLQHAGQVAYLAGLAERA